MFMGQTSILLNSEAELEIYMNLKTKQSDKYFLHYIAIVANVL